MTQLSHGQSTASMQIGGEPPASLPGLHADSAEPAAHRAAHPYAVIAVALPVPRRYHYKIPTELLEVLEPGHGVLVPFGPRKVSGFVLERTSEPGIEPARLKNIDRLLNPEPLFDPSMLPLFQWTADYYHHPLGEVIRTALPAGLLAESHLTCTLTDAALQVLEADPRDMAGTLGERESAQVELVNAVAEITSRLPVDSVALKCTPAQLELLRVLHARGPQLWSRLMERPPVPGTAGLLRRLEQQGLLKLEQQVRDARVRALEVQVYRPTVELDPRTLKGALQQAVLELLFTLGEADTATLREGLDALGQRTSSLPQVLRRLQELELIEVETQERWREPEAGLRYVDQLQTPTLAQQDAIHAISQALETRMFSPLVLQGVTGSGKTEVYLQAVARVLEQGRGAVVLVPEISLTPQLVGRFQARFGEGIACLHSAMSPGERFDAWRKLLRGEARVAIGARSALFAPVRDPGLFIVDEEHDSSFKQDSGLRYNARDLAVVRARDHQAVVLLGSATPSLETWANTRRARFVRLELPTRVLDRPLPSVLLLDMTHPDCRPLDPECPLSPPLEQALQETVARGQQAILLLNRRGFAPYVMCPGCGGAFRCLHCDISLTYHRRRNLLLCHYCGLTRALPKRCTHCGHEPLELMGLGTEKLEFLLQERLPGIKVGRLDRDSVSGKGGHARILDAFRQRELQVLVGTQMVVKGHDFPDVTLVGILNADYALNLPDFRAAERTFQLVTQVAGRSGRGEIPGKVLVQSYAPDHPSLRLAASHDLETFYKLELKARHRHHYPPFSRLALIQVSARTEAQAQALAQEAAKVLRAEVAQDAGLEVCGPAPAPLSRLHQWFRWQVLLKSSNAAALHPVLRALETHPGTQADGTQTRLAIDMDPLNLL